MTRLIFTNQPCRVRRAAYLGIVLFFVIAGCSGRQDRVEEIRQDDGTTVELYLVRHAEAYKNVPASKRPPGMSDADLDALTIEGRRRADAIAEVLSDKHITSVYCSPLNRCRQTAAAIAAAQPDIAAPTASAAFAPLSEGGAQSDAGYGWDWRVENWKRGVDARPPGGESLAEGVRRARSAIDEWAQSHHGATIVVVSHGDIIPGLLGEAAGTPMADRCFEHDVPGGSISQIEIKSGDWRIIQEGKSK